MPSEARCLLPRFWRTGDVQSLTGGVELIVSGIGPQRASDAATVLVERGVKGLASFGIAGGLAEGLGPGDLVLSESVIGESGDRWATDKKWREALGIRLQHLTPSRGAVAESSRVVATPSDKRALHLATEASIVDMESASVLQAAAQRKLPGLVVRAVADDATTALPTAVRQAFDSQGNIRPGRCAMRALRDPRIIPDLIRVARGFSHATRTLKAVVTAVGGRLSFELT